MSVIPTTQCIQMVSPISTSRMIKWEFHICPYSPSHIKQLYWKQCMWGCRQMPRNQDTWTKKKVKMKNEFAHISPSLLQNFSQKQCKPWTLAPMWALPLNLLKPLPLVPYFPRCKTSNDLCNGLRPKVCNFLIPLITFFFFFFFLF